MIKIPELKFSWSDFCTQCYESDTVCILTTDNEKYTGYFREINDRLDFVVTDEENDGDIIEIENIVNWELKK